MDFSPKTVRRIFTILFSLNRWFRLVLVYCLFYHTIWWLPNSTSSNLAINYNNIDSYLFFIIVYFNFNDLLINQLLTRYFLYNFVKYSNVISTHGLKIILNIFELLFHLSINILIFYYLKYGLNYCTVFIFFLMSPNLFFLFYFNFDINVKVLNFSLFTNHPNFPHYPELINNIFESKSLNESVNYFLNNTSSNNDLNSNNLNTFPNNSKENCLTYQDCSNLSINSFLNNPIKVPNVTSFSLTDTINNSHSGTNTNMQLLNDNYNLKTAKIIKQSLHRTKTSKTKMVNCSFSIFRLPFAIGYFIYYSLILVWQNCQSSFDWIMVTCSNFPKTSSITIYKKSSINRTFTKPLNVHHRCSKEPSGLREETEYFKAEYNNRFKQVICLTIESIYFNFLITRQCVPSNVMVRDKEFFLYFISASILTFISYWLYFMPLSFLVSLNRNAEHLGCWHEIKDYDLINFKINKWSDNKIYCSNEKVNYMSSTYQVQSLFCISVPGNRLHNSFYKLFIKPIKIVFILLMLEILSFSLLLIITFINRRWYTIVMFIIEILCNSHTFFVLCRDFFVLYESKNLKMNKKFN